MRLSTCFLCCLLSRPQAAAALQRNTRPSTHDAPLPVHGQETIRPVTLPHYHAGKVSFFVHSCQNYNKTICKDFRSLNYLFFCPKKDKSQFPFFAFQGIVTVEFLRLYQGPRRERKDLFHGHKRIFSCGQPREITGRPLE